MNVLKATAVLLYFCICVRVNPFPAREFVLPVLVPPKNHPQKSISKQKALTFVPRGDTLTQNIGI